MTKIYAVYSIVKLTEQPQWLNDFRKKYDEAYDLHVTLKQPAYIEENQLNEIKRILNDILVEFKNNNDKIKLIFDNLKLDKVDDNNKTGNIYIFSSNNSPLNNLQKKIRDELKKYSEYLNPKFEEFEYDFRPHITIARELNNTKLEKALTIIKNEFVCEGEVTEIILSCVNEISVKEAHDPNNLTKYTL